MALLIIHDGTSEAVPVKEEKWKLLKVRPGCVGFGVSAIITLAHQSLEGGGRWGVGRGGGIPGSGKLGEGWLRPRVDVRVRRCTLVVPWTQKGIILCFSFVKNNKCCILTLFAKA